MRATAGYQFLQRDCILSDERRGLVIPGQEFFAIVDAPGFCACKWIVALPKPGLQNERKTAFKLGEFAPAAGIAAPRIINPDGGGALMGEALCKLRDAPGRRRNAKHGRQLSAMPRDQSHLGIAAGK